MRIFAFALFLLLPMVQASAQTTPYVKWQNPDVAKVNTEKLKDLVTKLNALIDNAEKAGAADPNFLRDLRILASAATAPQLKLIFNDTFADGNFTTNPAWETTAGEFWVEQGWGLRTSVDLATKTQPQTKKVSGEQAAVAIFGQILNQALGAKQTGGGTEPQTPAEAVLHTNAAVSNSFSVALNLYTGSATGRIELALYQGQFTGSSTSPGYRLSLQPEGRLEIARVSSRGRTVIGGTNELPSLQDKKFHTLTWTRAAGGTMEIRIDNTALLSAADQGFSDAFSGIAIINGGGDYIFKQIRVDGL